MTATRHTPPALPDSDTGRLSPLEMSSAEFREVGHRLVERIAGFLEELPSKPVTPGEGRRAVRAALGDARLPGEGAPAHEIFERAADLLVDHSLFNGHPRFWGYITSSAAPIGALADLLASALNPNTGAWILSPMATEIEAQTIRWIAELLGYPTSCGGLLVSGGNMANFVGVLAARRAKLTWDVREQGLGGDHPRPTLYASEETHTWIQKAADLFGFGLESIRWIPVDASRRMDVSALERRVRADREAGRFPLLVVGTAGSVSVGAIDPLAQIAAVARAEGMWFHVDGAYGAPAALLPELEAEYAGMREADSIAMDPHKWLYAPVEAGCTLVRDPAHLEDAFSFHPPYYHFQREDDERLLNYHNLGPQNSRGFRALKVWLGLQQAGREGMRRMIADDCALARLLHETVAATPELEARTLGLSISTFRFVPAGLPSGEASADYLNDLNRALLERLQGSGEAFVSNAVIDGEHLLRACIVNFRTTRADVEALPEIVVRHGRALDAEMRPETLRRA